MVYRRWVPKSRAVMGIGMALALSACATTKPDQPDFSKLNLQAYQQEQASYAVCVAVNAIGARGANGDVDWAAAQATHRCSTAGLTKILATADCTDRCAGFVMQMFQAQMRQVVTEGLIQRQQARIQ